MSTFGYAQPMKADWGLIREHDCQEIFDFLEEHDGQAWPMTDMVSETGIPQTTARRLVVPYVGETRRMDWLLGLRPNENPSARNPSADFTTRLHASCYAQIITNPDTTYFTRNGVRMVRTNTSMFPLVQRIGREFNYKVVFDPTIRAPRGYQGRARARYVGPAYQWSHGNKLNKHGYPTEWC